MKVYCFAYLCENNGSRHGLGRIFVEARNHQEAETGLRAQLARKLGVQPSRLHLQGGELETDVLAMIERNYNI